MDPGLLTAGRALMDSNRTGVWRARTPFSSFPPACRVSAVFLSRLVEGLPHRTKLGTVSYAPVAITEP